MNRAVKIINLKRFLELTVLDRREPGTDSANTSAIRNCEETKRRADGKSAVRTKNHKRFNKALKAL